VGETTNFLGRAFISANEVYLQRVLGFRVGGLGFRDLTINQGPTKGMSAVGGLGFSGLGFGVQVLGFGVKG